MEATTKKNEKKQLISSFLKSLRRDEVQPAVAFLTGRAFPEGDPRILEIGGMTLWKILGGNRQTPLISVPLTIRSVAATFAQMALSRGKGSREAKESLLRALFIQATSAEANYLTRILVGEMRLGAVEGVVLEAIADAGKAELSQVRRANMLMGNLGEVAELTLNEGADALERVRIQLYRPIKPMLAEMSYDLGEVFKEHGGVTAFEYKFDGARIQIHKKGIEFKVFSRRLTDVTQSVPDIVELARKNIRAEEALVEGEVVACGREGKPLPFQDFMRRFTRVHDVANMVEAVPLRLCLFDVLYLNGEMLIDVPYEGRWKLLAEACEESVLAPRIVTGDRDEAEKFLESALREGHEGLMAKALSSDYTPGVRGKKWFKIKPFDRLDLVIVAAEWGYGRREGWLSNYHLAARDEETNRYVMLGKTFKGLTDEEFAEMTRRLKQLKISEDRYTVYVKPEIVVEVAYNEIQRSPRYRSGLALRFARIARIRADKAPRDADTIKRINALYERQFEKKAKNALRP